MRKAKDVNVRGLERLRAVKRRRGTVFTGWCAFCALLFIGAIVLAMNLLTPTSKEVIVCEPPPPPRRKAAAVPARPKDSGFSRRANPRVFDAEAFKKTIIDNNLFRPLGWTPPRPKEPYRLLGTVLPTDDRTPPTAILQTTAGNQTYIVMTGETLDASTEVVEIKPKQVVLSTEGQRRTLRLTATHYLNPARVSRRVVSTRRPTPQRPPQGVRRTPTPTRAPTAALSEWQTREGEIIRIGDARLKNPAKWELQRRSRVK